jgi:hypothetical protein
MHDVMVIIEGDMIYMCSKERLGTYHGRLNGVQKMDVYLGRVG